MFNSSITSAEFTKVDRIEIETCEKRLADLNSGATSTTELIDVLKEQSEICDELAVADSGELSAQESVFRGILKALQLFTDTER